MAAIANAAAEGGDNGFSVIGETSDDVFERLVDAFAGQRIVASLQERGVAVVDGALHNTFANKLLHELDNIYIEGAMLPNQVRFTAAAANGKAAITATKPHIFEADLHEERIRARDDLKSFRALFDTVCPQIVEALDAVGFERKLVKGNEGCAVKLQYNIGQGGCFPLHYDNPGNPNKRQLTCLVYLNPEWKDGDGGELEIVPFVTGTPSRIRPLFNRMVLFRSDLMLHRVLSCHAPRRCFTIWVDGPDVNAESERALPKSALSDSNAIARAFTTTPLQRDFARLVYEEEFRHGLEVCMDKNEIGSQQMLARHHEHVERVLKSERTQQLVKFLRALREQAKEKNMEAEVI